MRETVEVAVAQGDRVLLGPVGGHKQQRPSDLGSTHDSTCHVGGEVATTRPDVDGRCSDRAGSAGGDPRGTAGPGRRAMGGKCICFSQNQEGCTVDHERLDNGR
jgi:hypothetical protein